MRSKGVICDLGTRRHPRDPPYNAEDIRAYEVRRVFNKLSLSLEQSEAIENLSRSRVDELVYGPIAETVALSRCRENWRQRERWRGRVGVQVARAQ